MATRLAITSGNLTTAGTWVSNNTGTNCALTSTSTGTTALTTGNLDSATFTPTAAACQYLGIRLGSRAAGSPTNTMTITLVNSTAPGLRVPAAWVINVSDLPACTTADDDGGWIWLKANATFTPNGTDVYLVRATLSATTTAVSLCTNGTANNWQRILCLSATGAPAAGDDMHIAGLYSNAASPATTPSTLTVTMDQTAATDYGSANTDKRIPCVAVSSRGVLNWGTTASTAYVLQNSGWQVVYSNGTVNQGTVATPIPRGTGSATLQFDCAADGDFGLAIKNGATYTAQGLSRTAAKNFSWTLLTADAAAAATSITVADNTGWLNGDVIALASTDRTATHAESVTLGADAGASSITVGALANAHTGSTTEKMQAEVVLLTRQVAIKSVSTTAMSAIVISATAQVDMDWVDLRFLGSATILPAIDLATTTGSATFNYCILRDGEATGFRINGIVNGGTVTIQQTCGYKTDQVSTSGVGFINYNAAAATTGVTIDNVVCIANTAINGFAPIQLNANPQKITLTNVYVSSHGGNAGAGIDFSAVNADYQSNLMGPFYLHSGGSALMYFSTSSVAQRLKFDSVYAWRSTAGIRFNCRLADVNFSGTTLLYGHSLEAIEFDTASALTGLYFKSLSCYGDTTFSQPKGINFDGGQPVIGVIMSGDFGTVSGKYAANTSADIDFSTNGSTICTIDLSFLNTNLASATPVNGFVAATQASPSRLRFGHYQRSATQHKVNTPYGDVTYETTTVDASPSIKLTPSSTLTKLDTAAMLPGEGWYVPVDNGGAITASVKVQKDASYNGNAARLIVKANAALGITTDTVLATHSAASGSFQTLSGTTATVTAKGVLEFIVDCDGTAGNIFVDTFTVSGSGTSALSGLDYWYYGLSC